MSGWVCLHRKIREWEWYDDANTFRVFFHCLISANWRDKSWKGITIGRGSFFSSYEKIGDALKLSKQQVRTSISKLKSTRELTLTATHNGLLITVSNYASYNDANQPDQHSKQHKVTQSSNTALTPTKQEEQNKQVTAGAPRWIESQLMESERLSSEGKLLEALSVRINVDVESIKAITKDMFLPNGCFDAYLINRASEDWRTKARTPISTSTWRADLMRFASNWQYGATQESPAKKATAPNGWESVAKELFGAAPDEYDQLTYEQKHALRIEMRGRKAA